MMRQCRRVMALAVSLAAFAAVSANGQQNRNSARIAYTDPIASVDYLIDPQPETSLGGLTIFDGIIAYDSATHEFKPMVAESWTRQNETTLDLKIRQDIKFHDGIGLTAEDVAYSIAYYLDPTARIRFNFVAGWLDRVEVVDGWTVRLHEKGPAAYDLAVLSQVRVYPKRLYAPLTDKSEFGRRIAIGTGPYKFQSLSSDKGVVLVKNPDFKSPGPWRPAARLDRLEAIPVPDLQTQIALMIRGEIDVIRKAPIDTAEQLKAMPGFAATTNNGLSFLYMSMDAVNRSGNAALSNQDVRRALVMSVDRSALRTLISPQAKVIDTLCVGKEVGCPDGADIKPPATNVEAARKLLAAAGYPSGFDVEITAIPGSGPIAEAISGQLRKIGVRATVIPLTFVAFRDRQAAGRLQILVGWYSPGGVPDVYHDFGGFFEGARDYWNDKEIYRLKDEASRQFDPTARTALHRRIFDRINERSYILPLITYPATNVHSAGLAVGSESTSTSDLDLLDLYWK